MVENIDDSNLITSNLGELYDNTKHVENSKALSGYRDWITYFKNVVRKELDADWFKVQCAVYKKVRGGKVNYADSELKYISKLKEGLRGVNMTLKDFELLILLKVRSNQEFHGNETQEHAKQRLQIFPEEIGFFKEPLLKLFNALEIWNI
ncbi:2421_t:CDS:2 [Funneliformis geosporum]|uniref:1879_t:CDS:1 n=1 Tax=Funneliformis geosporum TaxID=1117311 RepID=A0A9W4WQI4_9GLOM|nr:2421_t:CDS:2 [Funneliformis geosporum]CAI2171307.1 1879_t:CDS:2 [Funneliformis geosporum]